MKMLPIILPFERQCQQESPIFRSKRCSLQIAPFSLFFCCACPSAQTPSPALLASASFKKCAQAVQIVLLVCSAHRVLQMGTLPTHVIDTGPPMSPPLGDVPDDVEPDEQPEVEENEEILVPEQVLAHKDTKTKGKIRRRFLVKFKNCPALDAKWMEKEDLADTPQIVKLYLEAFGLA
ncbi:hypothetical protein L7F22_029662 [Adiantum nelumboides]|nr:hypothetical protein [Adiantum nelumboides]